MNNVLPAQAIHPGRILKREMEARGWDDGKLWRHTDLSLRRIGELLDESAPIDTVAAETLARAFGTSAAVWLNLQKEYDEMVKETP